MTFIALLYKYGMIKIVLIYKYGKM